MAGNKLNNIIYIGAADHSGSTLIGCILGSDNDSTKYFHLGEVYAFFAKKRFGDLGRHKRNKTCGDIWKKIDPYQGHESIYSQIAQVVDPECIIDSSKTIAGLYNSYNFVTQNSLRFNLVITVRPIEKIFQSDKSRNRSFNDTLASVSRYKKYLEFIRKHDVNFVSVNIDNLIMQPVEKTKKLCNKTGIHYIVDKEKYWNFKHCHLYGAKTQMQHISQPRKASYCENKAVQSAPELSCEEYKILENNGILKAMNYFLDQSI